MELTPGAMVTPGIRLVEPLGDGAMGSVWSARHLSLDTEVAIKFIADELADDDAILERFELEAKAAAKIKSPHVVQTLDRGVAADDTPYIVMELLRGNNLRDWIALTGPMKLMQVGQLVSQVGKVLSKAHGLGIVHRDIKPENLFLVDDDDLLVDEIFVKVLDFGLAKRTRLQRSSKITLPGMVLGTPPYMSPEQLMGTENPNPEADLWGLAVVAYEALTGELPFGKTNVAQIISHVVTGKMLPPSARKPSVPPEIDEWFQRALSHELERRFGSAKEMAEAWHAAIARANEVAQVQRSTFPSRPAPPDEPTLVNVSPVWVALGAGTCAVLGVAATVLVQGLGASESVERAPPEGAATAHPPAGPAVPEMVRVEAGEAWIGCVGRQCRGNERPKRRVAVDAFAIDVTEVPVSRYVACVSAGGCSDTRVNRFGVEGGTTMASDKCNFQRPGRDDHPMNCVTWQQAQAYCMWAGKRLPREIEWERAARGTDGRAYPWGNEAASCRFAVMADGGHGCGREGTWPVGFMVRGASPSGAYDMAGNVWEWVGESYREPSDDDMRVIRGGCFQNKVESYLRASTREEVSAKARRISVGFRCAGDATASP